MDFAEVINIVLPIVYVLVGAALVWLVIELVLMVRKTRKIVEEVQKQVEPTLAHVEEITNSLKPVVAKMDPLVERVSLTVDAANLEIMRVDQILDDVNGITGSLSSAVDAVDAAANAPLELVNSVSNRVRNVFKTRKASDASLALAEDRRSRTVVDTAKEAVKTAGTVAQDVAQAASVGADEAHARTQERRADNDAVANAKHAASERTNRAATQLAEAVQAAAAADADMTKEKYFTYAEGAAGQAPTSGATGR